MAWDDYAKHLSDVDTLALCRKVTTMVDDKVEAEFPAQMSGSVRIKTSRGTFETFVRILKASLRTSYLTKKCATSSTP